MHEFAQAQRSSQTAGSTYFTAPPSRAAISDRGRDSAPATARESLPAASGSGHDFSRVPAFSRAQESEDASKKLFKTWGSAGGLSGLTLDVTFSVSDTPASSLQAIQTFCGTRRTDGKQVGTYSWVMGGKTYDAFVDGGKNSPYVTMGGNAAAHPTKPYYLTADEVKKQVSFTKDAGTIRVYDAPGAVAMHDEAYFETAIVAVDFKGKGKDKILKAFKWGWTGKGTTPTVSKGTEIAGKASGVNVSGSVSPEFKNIVKHDYSSYTYDE